MSAVKIFDIRGSMMHRFLRKHKRIIATIICVLLALALLLGPIVGFVG